MYQYTTPDLTIRMPRNVPVGNMTNLVVTILQESSNVKLNKDLNNLVLDTTNNVIKVYLTQVETGRFEAGNVSVQCHFRIDDKVMATKEMKTSMKRNIHGEVLT